MSVTGPIRHQTAAASILPLTATNFRHVMPHAPGKFLHPLNAAMTKYGICTAKRVAGFLGQLAVESMELRHTHEFWSAKRDFHLSGLSRHAHTAASKKGYFEYWYGKRADLGNTTAEDGYTYRGRGAIQITGRSNYRAIGLGIGKPLETRPDLLEKDDAVDMLASAFFFAVLKRLNPVADSVDPKDKKSVEHVNMALTRAVNGKYNALTERLEYFRKALSLLHA